MRPDHILTRTIAGILAAGILTLLVGCAPTSPGTALPTADPSTASRATSSATPSAHPSLCAEFPARAPTPGDVEGFFNATPADENGDIITDPALWTDPRMLAHPRVALVSTDTGAVITKYDRVTCGEDPDCVAAPGTDWPRGRTAVVDIDTGEVIEFAAAS